jgi:hypothetical protein
MQRRRPPALLITRLLPFCPMLTAAAPAHAQQVQPVIMEYRSKAEGRLTVINNTLQPMVVVLEPKSFSISPDGHGTFRPLDPTIHVQLSVMSVKLQPLQSYAVFYKADAESFPAWFSIYSTFSPARASGASVNVRIQLPHTVYLYQSKPIERDDIHVLNARYSNTTRKLTCDLMNVGKALTRVQEVRTSGVHTEPVMLSGFPLLPGALRTIVVDWKGKEPPTALNIAFERFTLKPPFAVENDPPPSAVSSANLAATGTASPPLTTGK